MHHSSYKAYLVKQDASIIRVNVYFKAGYIVGKEGLRWVLTWPHCPAGSGCARKAVLNTALIPKCRKKVMWYDWLTIFNTNRKWHLNNSNISSDLHGDYIYFYYVFTIPPLKRGFAGKKDWWPFSLNLIQLKRNCNPKVHKTHFYRFWHTFLPF